MKRAIFYHAGCPVCTEAQQGVVDALDRSRFDVEIVNLVKMPELIDEAEKAGVKTLPALVIDGKTFHINYGGTLRDIKKMVGQPDVDDVEVWEVAQTE